MLKAQTLRALFGALLAAGAVGVACSSHTRDETTVPARELGTSTVALPSNPNLPPADAAETAPPPVEPAVPLSHPPTTAPPTTTAPPATSPNPGANEPTTPPTTPLEPGLPPATTPAPETPAPSPTPPESPPPASPMPSTNPTSMMPMRADRAAAPVTAQQMQVGMDGGVPMPPRPVDAGAGPGPAPMTDAAPMPDAAPIIIGRDGGLR